VTQWEVLGCCPAISENFLIPVLEQMLARYPFPILGFHCDNGSEYINYRVAAMLNKLLAEFTKSRPCRSTDNALVEGKNGAVVRKHMGYGLIGSEWAGRIHSFYAAHRNDYLNYHRPCGFATVEVNKRGKRRRHYKTDGYRTPYEKLTSLSKWKSFLKPGVTAQALDRLATQHSDTEAALLMQSAKFALLSAARSSRAGSSQPQLATGLGGARGLQHRPSPRTPLPQSRNPNERTSLQNVAPSPENSGSSRIGIKSALQSHLWIGKCSSPVAKCESPGWKSRRHSGRRAAFVTTSLQTPSRVTRHATSATANRAERVSLLIR